MPVDDIIRHYHGFDIFAPPRSEPATFEEWVDLPENYPSDNHKLLRTAFASQQTYESIIGDDYIAGDLFGYWFH